MCKFEKQAGLTPFFCDASGGRFVHSEEGFYCFERTNGVNKCAHFNNTKGKPASKGVTRDGHSGKSKIPDSAVKILREFYAPYNADFEREFRLGFGWSN